MLEKSDKKNYMLFSYTHIYFANDHPSTSKSK